MKKVFNLALLFAMASSILFVGCKKEETSTVEARIKTIQIVNGGLSGGDLYTGVVNEDAKTVTFEDVAAETNIAAIKFSKDLSLGANFDAETYDFTNTADPNAMVLTQSVTIINGTVSQTYEVTIHLIAPTQAPVLTKLVVVDDANVEHELTNRNILDETILLGCPESEFATVKDIVLAPARAKYTFTAAEEGKISKADPGVLRISFMGLETQYYISFGTAPAAGADFSNVAVHDFSVATENAYSLYAGEMVRGADFDGKYVLIAHREAPEVHLVENLLKDNTSAAIKLKLTGVEGGTHMISSGKLAQGHIYLCNLPASGVSTSVGNGPLKVYHYATPESEPEVVLEWAGTNTEGDTIYTGRLGDNIAVNIDESGNGYAYFSKQQPGDKIFRFTVKNFTEFSEPFEIIPPAMSDYYGFYNQVGPNQYLFTSSYPSPLWLLDADGNLLMADDALVFGTTTAGARLAHGVDHHIIEFNRATYLIFTVANSKEMHWNFGPAFYLMDITEGNSIVEKLMNLQAALWPEDDEAPTVEPAYQYVIDATGATSASACVAHANAAEIDGKLVLFTSAANAGFALIEVSRAQ